MEIPTFGKYGHRPDIPMPQLRGILQSHLTKDTLGIVLQYSKPEYVAFEFGKRWLVGTPHIYIQISPERTTIYFKHMGFINITSVRIVITKDFITGIDYVNRGENYLSQVWYVAFISGSKVQLTSSRCWFEINFDKLSIRRNGDDVYVWPARLRMKPIDDAVLVLDAALG